MRIRRGCPRTPGDRASIRQHARRVSRGHDCPFEKPERLRSGTSKVGYALPLNRQCTHANLVELLALHDFVNAGPQLPVVLSSLSGHLVYGLRKLQAAQLSLREDAGKIYASSVG